LFGCGIGTGVGRTILNFSLHIAFSECIAICSSIDNPEALISFFMITPLLFADINIIKILNYYSFGGIFIVTGTGCGVILSFPEHIPPR